MHHYPFHVADYRKDTVHLTPFEHYVYRTLIDWYYLDERPIPLDEGQIMRRLAISEEQLPGLHNVLDDFFKKSEKGYIHKRIEEEIKHYKLICDRNRVNGKQGGRPKKTQVVSKKNRMESQPRTKNQEPRDNIDNFTPDETTKLWAKKNDVLNLDAHVEPFINKVKAKGYKYKNLQSAFKEAVRNDWAKLGHGRKRRFQHA